LRLGLFVLLPILLIAGGYRYITGGQVMSTDDAYVEADKVGISTDVSGIVQEIDVTENQQVAVGQVLYRLDDAPFRYALARATAQVGSVKDALNALKANYRDMQAQIQQAQHDVEYSATEFHRQQNLLNAHVASQSTFDMARRNLQNAQGKLASLTQQLAAIAANLDGDPDGPVEQNPRYADAVAQRNEAARQLAHTIVKAPFAGIVTNVPAISLGKYLAASATAFYLVATDHVWVDANPKETELTFVRPGQPVTVTVDTYPDMQWKGTVESISPAASQEFSLLPAQNSSGNWVKVVQRIPMRVRVDTSDSDLPPLRAGMSAEVDVDTGHARGLPRFLTSMLGSGAPDCPSQRPCDELSSGSRVMSTPGTALFGQPQQKQ
jgi:membrane fusion protein (multidrug efflux system)